MKEIKKNLRKEIKAFYASLSQEELIKKSLSLSNNLGTFLHEYLGTLKNPKDLSSMGVFAPLGDEVQWHLAKEMEPFSHLYAFPDLRETETKRMNFYLTSFEKLKESRHFGVTLLTPPEDAKMVNPEILIVPGLAFDLNGYRLGRGGGFYDRYLSTSNNFRIAICFEEQLIEKVPQEEHDLPVDMIITDKTIHKIIKEKIS